MSKAPEALAVNLANIGNGAAMERFDFELTKVMSNIKDVNTDAEKKRSITLVESFKFGQWIDQEAFIIGLQAHVKDEGDRQYLLDLTSRIALNENLEIADNGVSQDVTAKTGTSLKQLITLKPRVSLAPFRTFREIDQPVSEFIFRVRKSARGTPELALFEADGGAWKLTAMESIAKYLTNAIANDAATVIY